MINKVILIGNLGRDPEVRTTPSGQTVASFSIATTRKWRDKDGARQEQTEWHNIVVWGRSAEVAGQYLTKGKQIYVEGRLQTRSWDDRTSGEKRYRTEIVCENFQMLGTAGGGGGGSRPEGGGRYEGGGRSEAGRSEAGHAGGGYGPEPDLGDFGGDDDDIPF